MTGAQVLPDCPRCSTALLGVSTRGPTDHRAQPCGCRLTGDPFPA